MVHSLTVRAGDAYDRERWRTWLAEHGLDIEDVYQVEFLDDGMSRALANQYDRDKEGLRFLINGEVATKPGVVFAVKRHPPKWVPR